jgi:hypothetical protein
MDEETQTKIEEIIGGMKCPKDFKCYKSGFETLCKSKDIGLKVYLVCLEEEPGDCKFSISFGRGYYCKCPLRGYISKELKK